METPNGYLFEFVGGRPSLDFANTVSGAPRTGVFDERLSTTTERLPTYAELLRWSIERGVVSPEQGRKLQLSAQRDPHAAEAVRLRAVTVREALFELFLARVQGRAPADDALERVNRELGVALSHQRLRSDGGTVRLGWDDELALDAMLWPVVRDGVEVLSAAEIGPRLKVCEASHENRCDWLFLDETKSNTRRWCSMKDCGNKAKQRRHYARKKAE
jgi:predicted RNA-binding Zn ribbon-like protein